MPYKISFECSRPLTEDELNVVRNHFVHLTDVLAGLAVKPDANGNANFDDVPEYFYVVPLQEEIK